MLQSMGQEQIGQPPQMAQQTSIPQGQQQITQSQINQQRMAQAHINQQQITQAQMNQQQMAQAHINQQQMAQQQMSQQQIAQSQMAQQQMSQQQLAQSQMVQQQMAQQINQPQLLQQQMTHPQMIQQQLQQQLGQQQLQQMMYCPTVRLVYDSPMPLMQPGDQLQQQNQNIFVNQPPWARPVQNQVIYVQQIGSNLVPVQHLDPNMFLQQNIPNIPMYQQVVQNVPQLVQNLPQTVQSLPQGQIRQILNNIPAGMVPSFGANVQRMPEQNLGQMVQNFGIVQANTDVNMSNVNVINNEVDRQAIPNQANTHQNAPTQELLHVYRQVVPQINQQQPRTQVSVPQQQNVQNVQSVGQQTVTNMGQTVGQNVRPVASNMNINASTNIGLKVNNNVRQNTTQTIPNNVPNTNQNIIRTSSSSNVNTSRANVGTNTQQIRQPIHPQNVHYVPQTLPLNLPTPSAPMQNFATAVGTLNTVTYSAVRNGQPYTYRAIQPKPNSNNVRFNFKPRVNQTPMVRRPVPTNINQNVNMISTSNANFIKMETEPPTFNKKRKSESPDEIHKKISNYGSITVTSQVKDKIKAKYANTSDIGVNTSPIHKMHKVDHNKVENQLLLPLLQINPMEAKIKQEFHSPTMVPSNTTPVFNNSAIISIKSETELKDKKDLKDVSLQTEEKLVRKTVFPQAKATGRLLDAKANLDMPRLDEPVSNINIIQNESIKTPQLRNELKTNITQTNYGQPIPITNNKQHNTFNDIAKVEETTVELIINITKPNYSQPIPLTNNKQHNTFNDIAKVEESTVELKTNITQPNYSQPIPLLNNKHHNTFNDIAKVEETTVAKTIAPIGTATILTENNVEIPKTIETPIDIHKTKTTKVEFKTSIVPLETMKTVGPVLRSNEPKIIEPCVFEKKSELKIEKENRIEDDSSKQTPSSSNFLKIEEPVQITKTDTSEPEAKITTKSDFEQDIKDNKIEKKEYKDISINEMNGKEIHIVDGNIHKEERDFVLTHVLDGFVIQESNVPFAIRRPLKEKTVNAYVEDKTDPCIKAAKDEIRGHILELSQLHLNEVKEKERADSEARLTDETEDITTDEEENIVPETGMESEETVMEADITIENPFESLEQESVKSWTVEDLITHLSKYNWTETVTTLQEHEIDGESLFLVTKSQLVTIGINEAHAEVICQFVGSKS